MFPFFFFFCTFPLSQFTWHNPTRAIHLTCPLTSLFLVLIITSHSISINSIFDRNLRKVCISGSFFELTAELLKMAAGWKEGHQHIELLFAHNFSELQDPFDLGPSCFWQLGSLVFLLHPDRHLHSEGKIVRPVVVSVIIKEEDDDDKEDDDDPRRHLVWWWFQSGRPLRRSSASTRLSWVLSNLSASAKYVDIDWNYSRLFGLFCTMFALGQLTFAVFAETLSHGPSPNQSST